MRRLLACCMALLLLGSCGVAQAAPDFDYTTLTIDELLELRAELDEVIEAKEAEESVGFYEDGTYLVGSDLPVGDYAIQERENAMFSSVSVRAGDSDDAALILHKLISGQLDIHLAKDTWVTLSEARAWPLGAEPSILHEDGSAGEGAYLVGIQLSAGDYLAKIDEKAPLASYSVYSGILGEEDALLTKFEVLHGETELELESGEYVELSGCTLTPIE